MRSRSPRQRRAELAGRGFAVEVARRRAPAACRAACSPRRAPRRRAPPAPWPCGWRRRRRLASADHARRPPQLPRDAGCRCRRRLMLIARLVSVRPAHCGAAVRGADRGHRGVDDVLDAGAAEFGAGAARVAGDAVGRPRGAGASALACAPATGRAASVSAVSARPAWLPISAAAEAPRLRAAARSRPAPRGSTRAAQCTAAAGRRPTRG